MTSKKRGNGELQTSKNPFQTSSSPQLSKCELSEVPELVTALQLAVTAGCAVMLGGTRDGGAWVITILDGENRHKTYCHTREELHNAVQSIIKLYVDW